MLFGLITLILVILKVTEVISISWLLVFSPLLAGIIFDFVMTMVLLKGIKK